MRVVWRGAGKLAGQGGFIKDHVWRLGAGAFLTVAFLTVTVTDLCARLIVIFLGSIVTVLHRIEWNGAI